MKLSQLSLYQVVAEDGEGYEYTFTIFAKNPIIAKQNAIEIVDDPEKVVVKSITFLRVA